MYQCLGCNSVDIFSLEARLQWATVLESGIVCKNGTSVFDGSGKELEPIKHKLKVFGRSEYYVTIDDAQKCVG